MKRTRKPLKLSEQMRRRTRTSKQGMEYDGDIGVMISTGSTLLDLAISGGRVRGGGIPGGILVEIFGPSGSGKTVLLSEAAGDVQRKSGEVMFNDPEARLNKQFAKIFGLNIDVMDYSTPDTVIEVFEAVRNWKPKKKNTIHGIFADSLAALSTDMEMGGEDKMGAKRAKDFSEQLRKTCRYLVKSNYLMMCSNQIRQSFDQYGPKYKSPGGEALGFYSSLRLRTSFALTNSKIKREITIGSKKVNRIVGVNIEVDIFKSSVWKPYRTAPVTILFDYGIDDTRQNLQYIKDHTGAGVYTLGDKKLAVSMEKAIQIVEREDLEEKLRDQVIDLWESIESNFKSVRKLKDR